MVLCVKILGEGELSVKVSIKARAFSSAAREKLESNGCSLIVLPGRKKWVKPSVAKNIARADEYFAKKRAAAAAAESASSWARCDLWPHNSPVSLLSFFPCFVMYDYFRCNFVFTYERLDKWEYRSSVFQVLFFFALTIF